MLLFFYKGKIFVVIIGVFFIIALINNINYYNYIPKEKEIIRVCKRNHYGGVGEANGRKVYLQGDLGEAKIGDRVFSEGKYIADIDRSNGVLGIYEIKNIKILEGDIRAKLYRFRENIFFKIKDKLGWRRASLITSISFGYTEFLDEEDKNDMKRLGLMHAVAVSGLHMALVYSFITKVVSNRIAPFVGFLYLIFTGASTSTMRAYIMILCMNLAIPLKRNYNPIAGISLAGIIILMIKPYGVFEVGFQLSFLATLGIILFNKDLNKWLYKLPKYIREGMAICISAQVFVFPVLIIYFKEFSISFILGNLILSPLISILIVLGNLLAMTIFIPEVFNYLCFITYYATRGIDIVLEILGGIIPPLVYLNENMALMYWSVLIGVYFYKKGYKQFFFMPLVAAVYICIVMYSPFLKIQYYRDGALLVSYRGDRVLMQFKQDLDINKYKKIAVSNKIYKNVKKMVIGNNIVLERRGKNFILKNNKREYLLLISKEKFSSDYDIINFRENKVEKIILFLGKIVILD